MLKTAVFAIGLVLPGAVLAADATAPVREIMKMTEANWSERGGEFQDIFDASRLKVLFSSDFAARYEKAMQGEYARESGSPFDYDVIVNGQDGCPLKNITITAAPPQGGVTDVKARFQAVTCFGQEAEYQAYNETLFKVVLENGKPVVDDIVLSMDGVPFSIKSELGATGGQ
ncbi:hypothetical protein [Pannonibacter phragmitetus]|uniref:hypothetical protein n=1 Tax=Pannonibacter phragmitetus TaxID=121719 RepID=UPI003D2F0A1A